MTKKSEMKPDGNQKKKANQNALNGQKADCVGFGTEDSSTVLIDGTKTAANGQKGSGAKSGGLDSSTVLEAENGQKTRTTDLGAEGSSNDLSNLSDRKSPTASSDLPQNGNEIDYMSYDETQISTPPKRSKNTFPNAELKNLEKTEDGRAVIAKVTHNLTEFFKIGLNPVKSDQELAERTASFFEACEKTRQLPTWEKYCLCMGYSRNDMYRWAVGMHKPSWGTERTCTIAQKVREILSGLDGELAAHGKIQPVVYFFRAKNFYDMQDRVDYVVTPGSSESISPDEAKQILDELPEGKPPYEG